MGERFHGMRHNQRLRPLRSAMMATMLALLINSSWGETRTYFTIGLRTCRGWLDHNESKGANDTRKFENNLGQLADRSWVAGYVTGVNKTTGNSRDLLDGLDLDTIADWITQFCESSPNAKVPDAIDALFAKLKRRQ